MGTDQKASRAVTAFWLVVAFLFGMLIQAERTPGPRIQALDTYQQALSMLPQR